MLNNNILNFSHYYKTDLKDLKKLNYNKIKILHHRPKSQFYEEKQLIKIIQSYKSIKGIVYGDDQISKKVIELLKKKNTKFIIKWGQGLDSIDLVSAKKNKIKVINFPGFFKTEVAELTVGFMLNLLRKINIIDENTKKLKWDRIFSYTLKKKTVGIIGLGHIGKEIAKKLKGFDVKILYQDPKVKIKKYVKTNIKTIFKKSNIIIIACNLNKDNEGFVNKSILKYSLLKPYLINITRGKLVNERDIVHFIKNKKISGYATDVFEHEPISKNNALLKYKYKTLFTNHTASITHEAVENINYEISKNIIKFI